jgi:endonuclease/exonuclease/phosphatase family metal-dependent hydrolase
MQKCPNDLTVLTYNTHLFSGSNAEYANQVRVEIAKRWPELAKKYPDIFGVRPPIIYEDNDRARYILNNVKDSGADIVALQEVWACDRQKWFIDKLTDTYQHSYYVSDHCKEMDTEITKILFELAKILGADNKDESSDSAFLDKLFENLKNNSGLLLLSKYPLEHQKFHEFQPGRTNGEDRLARKGIITATVRLPDNLTFRVSTLHADQDLGGSKMGDIWDLANYTPSGSDPAIMMGDFNLAGSTYDKMVNDIFVNAIDAYRNATHKQFNDPTIDGKANKLYNEFFGKSSQLECIDYVFLRRGGPRLTLEPKEASVIKDWKYGDDMDLSDHYPLRVKFEVIIT